jgi:hypothetical protein
MRSSRLTGIHSETLSQFKKRKNFFKERKKEKYVNEY